MTGMEVFCNSTLTTLPTWDTSNNKERHVAFELEKMSREKRKHSSIKSWHLAMSLTQIVRRTAIIATTKGRQKLSADHFLITASVFAIATTSSKIELVHSKSSRGRHNKDRVQ